jgi:hypothetical protein
VRGGTVEPGSAGVGEDERQGAIDGEICSRRDDRCGALRGALTVAGRSCESGRWYIWPLIVPPVYEKHSYITGELRRIWENAANTLSEATRTEIRTALTPPVADCGQCDSEDEVDSVRKRLKTEHKKSLSRFRQTEAVAASQAPPRR